MALTTGLSKLDSVEEVGMMIPEIYLPPAPESPKITVIPSDYAVEEDQFPGNVDFVRLEKPPDPSSFMRGHIVPQALSVLEAALKFEATVLVPLFLAGDVGLDP